MSFGLTVLTVLGTLVAVAILIWLVLKILGALSSDI